MPNTHDLVRKPEKPDVFEKTVDAYYVRGPEEPNQFPFKYQVTKEQLIAGSNCSILEIIQEINLKE